MGSEFTDDPFQLRPRQAKSTPNRDEENIRHELLQILRRAKSVASGSREDFAEGASSYDVASMLIIRMASLTERTDFTPWASLMTDDEVNAVRTIRNIVAHAGYATMNDDIFWNAVTVEVPEVVERLLKR